MKHIAKIFTNGRSQAVRLPKEFRFQGSEVFIEKQLQTGNLIISAKPSDWSGLRSALEILKPQKDFLTKKDRQQTSTKRDPFKGWIE